MYGNKINMKANQTGESSSYKFYLFMLEWSWSINLLSINLSLVNSKLSSNSILSCDKLFHLSTIVSSEIDDNRNVNNDVSILSFRFRVNNEIFHDEINLEAFLSSFVCSSPR